METKPETFRGALRNGRVENVSREVKTMMGTHKETVCMSEWELTQLQQERERTRIGPN